MMWENEHVVWSIILDPFSPVFFCKNINREEHESDTTNMSPFPL